MSVIFIVFPPAAGGNHLKNVLTACLHNDQSVVDTYLQPTPTVHDKRLGNSLQSKNLDKVEQWPDQLHVLHGHFAEIMSFQNRVRPIANKKFVLISINSVDDRKILNQRRSLLNYHYPPLAPYFESEQVFLYESFMYHWYFQVPFENIMNISVSQWFCENIDPVIDRLEHFLDVVLDRNVVNQLHNLWFEKIRNALK